jgi:hypothetical protein
MANRAQYQYQYQEIDGDKWSANANKGGALRAAR